MRTLNKLLIGFTIVLCCIFSIFYYNPLMALGITSLGLVIVFLIRDKNLPLYLFVLLYPILPDYFAIEFSTSLPLLTSARIILLFFVFFLIIQGRWHMSYGKQYFYKISNYKKAIMIMLFGEILVSIIALPSSQAINNIFYILTQKIIVFYALVYAIDNENVLEKCIKLVLIAAFVLSIFAIIETSTSFNVFSLLKTNLNRELGELAYERLGSRRAEGPFSHPIALGQYAIFVFPLSVWGALHFKNKILNTFIMIGIIVMTILTMSRAAMIIVAIQFAIIFKLSNKEQRKQYHLIINFVIVPCFIMSFIFINDVFNIISNSIISNIALFNNNIVLDNFGRNSNPFEYRLALISVSISSFLDHFFVGLGPGYFVNNSIYVTNFIYSSAGFYIKSIDNDYLYYLVTEGIVGFLAILYFRWTCLKGVIKQCNFKIKHFDLNKALFISLSGNFLMLFTVRELTSKRILWIVLAFFIVYNGSFICREEKNVK